MAVAMAHAVAAVSALRAGAPVTRAPRLSGVREANIPPVRREKMH